MQNIPQAIHQHAEGLKQAADYTLATTGLTAYWWYQYFEDGTKLFMMVGGAVLLALRIYIAVRDTGWCKRFKQRFKKEQ